MNTLWQYATLESICEIRNGLWKGKKPPFVEARVIRNTNFSPDGTLDESDIALLQVEKRHLEARRLQRGDIILEKSGGGPKQPVGRVVLFEKVDGCYSFSNFTSMIRVKDQQLLHPQFLHRVLHYFYTSGATETLQRRSTGIRNLVFSEYKQLKIPVPPLPEQECIVAILDKAIEGIDTAIVNTEKNLANATELFDSCLKSVYSNRDDSWITRTLDDAVHDDCSLSYGIVQPGKEYPDGLPIVRPINLNSRVIQLKGLKRIDPELAESYSRTKLTGDEILLCVRGTTGTVSIASKDLEGANVTRGIVPIRFDGSSINQKFGYYLLKSPLVQSQIREKTYGAALMQINLRDLRKVELTYPPLHVQERLLLKLDSLSETRLQLCEGYKRKLEALTELKQSFLQKAFSGELTQKAA